MSMFYVNVIAVNTMDRSLTTEPIRALVDTGAELTWLPRSSLDKANIKPEGKKRFKMANGQVIERDFGYAVLRADGYSTVDDVVFADDGDMSLLGVRTIEGFCVTVDNIAHRFVATTSLV